MRSQKRNSMFIKALTLTVAIMLTVIAAGCNIGPKKTGQQATEKTDEPQPTESATDELQPTQSATDEPQPTAVIDRNMPDDIDISGDISFMYIDLGMVEEMPGAIKAVVDAFQKKYPNVNVKVSNEGSARTNIEARISSGDIGDVFWCDPGSIHAYHNTLDVLLPLDSYISAYNIDLGNVYPGALEACKTDGSLYMVPVYAQEMVMVYNKTLLANAGIEWDNSKACTWDEFKNVCRQLTVINKEGVLTQSGLFTTLQTDTSWQLFLDGFGGEWIDYENHRVDFVNDDKVMTGIRELVSAIQEGWLYSTDLSYLNYCGRSEQVFNGTWESLLQNAAFVTVGPLEVVKMFGGIYDSLGIDWDICPFPALPTHKVYIETSGIAVYNQTKNPEAAAAFALFFLTPEGQRAFYSQSFKAVPSLKSLATEDFWRNGDEWTGKNMNALVSYPDNTASSYMFTRIPVSIASMNVYDFMSAVIRVADGRSDLVTAMTNLQDELNRKLIWSSKIVIPFVLFALSNPAILDWFS